MRGFARVALLALMVAPLGCGGAAQGGGAENQSTAVTPAGGGVAPVQESGGSAQSGGDCDFGGADRYTCGAGMQCCYPMEGEVAYGTCMQQCPE